MMWDNERGYLCGSAAHFSPNACFLSMVYVYRTLRLGTIAPRCTGVIYPLDFFFPGLPFVHYAGD